MAICLRILDGAIKNMYCNSVYQTFGIICHDLFRGTNINRTLDFLRNSQYWDEQHLRDYQYDKLIKLVKYAYKNVPYYTELFKKIKLRPSDITSLNDISKIPVLTKEDFRNNNHKLVSKNHSLRKIKKGKTGGTTGAPVFVYKDTQNRSFTWASYYRWYEWMGLEYGDPTATFWGARTVLRDSKKKKLIDSIGGALSNSIRINSFGLNEEGLQSAYKRLNQFKPKLLKGYLSALLDLATYIEKNNLKPLNPCAISSTTETLLPMHRTFLENVFGAPVYDQYGCGEVSAISYECKKHEGLHVTMEHVLCEILNTNNDRVLDERGRIVATDLDNYVMPVIRYETGDMSSISSKKCSCGRAHSLMKGIDGRTADTLQLKNGSRVHGVFVTDILAELNIFTDKIKRFQIQQNTEGEISFLYEKGIISPEINEIINLKRILEQFFTKVSMYETNEFKYSKSGKFRYVINNK